MRVIPIPLNSDDPNERRGLPKDYASLTVEGKRQARVNAVRQHLCTQDPEERALRFVRVVHFFDDYYLTADEEADFNPYFYDMWCPSPQGHDLFHFAAMRYRMSAGVGPRGFAKSYGIAKEILPQMLAEPVFRISYATSTDDLTNIMGERCKIQFEENRRVIDDFAPEYGLKGTLKKNRGSGAWGMANFTLCNNSSLFCTSAQSRQRGLRPRVYYLDDPEYDPKESTSNEVLRANVERLIFNVALPMVRRSGARCSWRGTFVTKQAYLWTAINTTKEEVDGRLIERPIDPRFGKWFRIIIPIVLVGKDGRERSAWPHMWPIDEAEKKALRLPVDTETIPEMRETLGESVFQAEYLANPGAGGASHFGDITDEAHGFRFGEPDVDFSENPWRSSTPLIYHYKGERHEIPLNKLKELGWRFYMTLDTSFTDTASSDYKAAGVFAVAPSGLVFFLDLWGEKCTQQKLVHAALTLAQRWRVDVMYPEAIKDGSSLVEDLQTIVRDNALEMLKEFDYIPTIIPFNPGTADKGSRIDASLTRRFTHGLFKFPLFLCNRHPWSLFLLQLQGFNPYARNCGLANDDFIDIAGMACSARILRGLPSVPQSTSPVADHAKKFREGQLVDSKTGIPTFLLGAHEITPADIATALNRTLYKLPNSKLKIPEHQLP